jgi:hypothetical protein
MLLVFLIVLYILISAGNLFLWTKHSNIQPKDTTDWVVIIWFSLLWPASIIMLLASIYDNYHKK